MSPQIACLREGIFTSAASICHHPLCFAVGKYENLKGLDKTIQSCIVCFCLTFLQCVFTMSPQIASLRLWIVTSIAFVWFFSTVRFQMFTQRAWVSTGKVTQSALFSVCYQIVLKMLLCGDVKLHKVVRQLLLLLQGEGNHLQKGVLLHLLQLIPLHHHVTPIWRCTWAGFALCIKPPSPPR